jgi:hypothetical protein
MVEYLKTVWFHPREAIQERLDSNSKWYLLLILLTGVGMRLDQASNSNLGDRVDVGYILFSAFIFGPILGILAWFMYSGLSHLMVRLFDGDGTWRETRQVFAWSMVPLLAKMLLWIPQLGLYGKEMFQSAMPTVEGSLLQSGFFLLFGLEELILLGWFFYILSQGLSAIHGFSPWKGFLSVILLPIILFFLLIVVFLAAFL